MKTLFQHLLWIGRKVSTNHITRLCMEVRLNSFEMVAERFSREWVTEMKQVVNINYKSK